MTSPLHFTFFVLYVFFFLENNDEQASSGNVINDSIQIFREMFGEHQPNVFLAFIYFLNVVFIRL